MTTKQFTVFMVTIILFFSIVAGRAQTTSSSVLVFPAVPLASCVWPAEVNVASTGYIALCNTTTGLAWAVSPSTTFTLAGGAAPTMTATAPIVVTGGVISCPSCATSPSGGPLKILTTVTATSVPQ